MKKQIERLKSLERIARMKSDLEMRRFSAFRANVSAAQGRIAALHAELQDLYDSPAVFTIAEARLANALAQEGVTALRAEEMGLERMMPGFEAARAAAVREFGRADVLRRLRDGMIAKREKAAEKARQ